MFERLIRGRMARHVDGERLAQKLESVHGQTSARVHVRIVPHFRGDVRATAEALFDRLPSAQSAVLFFVVPSRRQFVVLGGSAVHSRLGQRFWEDLAGELGNDVKSVGLTDGLIHAIDQVSGQLARHFPPPSTAE